MHVLPDCLVPALGQADANYPVPPIAVQAFFEGVVVNSMAAVDQIAQAANKALKLRLRPDQLVQTAFEQLGERLPAVQSWFDNPLGLDLRRLRTRMIHYSYVKAPGPEGLAWKVEDTGSGYLGRRELSDYATAAAKYVAELGKLLGPINQTLDARES